MTGHCFISYSTADGLEFARWLADELEGGEEKQVDIWFDKRDLNPARDWDDQIVEAIRDCQCLLFVMTRDSTAPGSVCKNEWTWALKYKKPVVPLRLHAEAEMPFGLGSRQWISFTEEFQTGLAKLHRYLHKLDSPKGILEALRDRLADAERDLRRAGPEDAPRIQAEIAELKEKIAAQEQVVKDPEAARKQTEGNIQIGLERERGPAKPVTGKAAAQFINPPPGIAPAYFQDRYIETREIVRFLQDDSQRLLTIMGRGGIGKTALVCRLLKALEAGHLPDDLGEMQVEGIVYLGETGSHRVNFANLFADLSRLLPAETTASLEALYKDPKASPAAKMTALLDRFPPGRVVLLLDNLEPLIHVETFELCDPELDEGLRAFLHGAHSPLKVILTTRIAPRSLNLCEPGRQRLLHLEEGLESPYAENLLREMDSDGTLGLKTAPDTLLSHARAHTRGYPRALEALFAILSCDRYTTLDEILATAENYLPENAVEALVGEAFSRLDGNAQQVMQALAVYNRPVIPAAVDHLLAPHLPGVDSTPVLNRLVSMHFVRRESGKYYLHPVDREFAFHKIPAGEEARGEGWDQHSLTCRAADYYKQARKPQAEWKNLDDLAAQLAEFDLRCAAGDYDTAAEVLLEYGQDQLLLWGHYRLIIDLHERLLGKISNKELAQKSLAVFGIAYLSIGKLQLALEFLEKALQMAREVKNRQAESFYLRQLGWVHSNLDGACKAIQFFEQSLTISREVGDRYNEGANLDILGMSYAFLGEPHKAIPFHEQALAIFREVGDQVGEGNTLGNLGFAYDSLGEFSKALEFYEQDLVIAREVGNRARESMDLQSIGQILLDLGKSGEAVEYFRQARAIADEIGSPFIQIYAYANEAKVNLFLNNLPTARIDVELACGYDLPEYNHNVSALLGIIALRQKDLTAAQAAFKKAIRQAEEFLAKTPDYYNPLEAKGLALCGLALCAGMDNVRASHVKDATEAFRAARQLTTAAGIVQRILRLFDELARADPQGLLAPVRPAVEGK